MDIWMIALVYFIIGMVMARVLIGPMEADARARVMAIQDPKERAIKESALTNAQTFGRPIAMAIIMLLWPFAVINRGLQILRK